MFNPNVRGPDVSNYQDNDETVQQIDFAKMRAAGASFVIVRAGQRSWADPDLSYNLLEARKAGLPTGAYFFYDSRETPEHQADLFLSLTKGINLDLGLWLDLEENYNGTYKGWQNWKKCLMRLRANTPDVGIYTGPYYWIEHRPTGAADLDYFKSFPLWIAHYGVSAPLIPGPWDYAVLWQIGTPAVGLEYGVESLELDMNYWNGSPESFRAYWGLTEQPPTDDGNNPPTETGATMQGQVLVNLNIRKTASTLYPAVGQLAPNDIVEGLVDPMGWWSLQRITRAGVNVPLPPLPCFAYGGSSNGYIKPLVAPPVPNPVTLYIPDSVTLHFPNGEERTFPLT